MRKTLALLRSTRVRRHNTSKLALITDQDSCRPYLVRMTFSLSRRRDSIVPRALSRNRCNYLAILVVVELEASLR